MISVIILTKNEEKNIERCLESVRWCDEIIIIDDESTDKTIEIARRFGAIIYCHRLNNNFSSQRNFGLSKAKNDWVLFIDADEVVSDALAYEISSAIQLENQDVNNYSGFYLKRSDFIWGKQLKYGETGQIRLLRLAKKDLGKWDGMTHERWKVQGRIGQLMNPILHYPHQSLVEFLKEINLYSDIRARELNAKNINVGFSLIFLYPLGKFLINYLLRRGFMDGIRGLIFAITMSFHSFLVRGKLWLKKAER
jgi:glycosyltransferase involved in cell wall biosynthesis